MGLFYGDELFATGFAIRTVFTTSTTVWVHIGVKGGFDGLKGLWYPAGVSDAWYESGIEV